MREGKTTENTNRRETMATKNTTKRRTAAETYGNTRNRIDTKLAKLQEALAKHAAQQKEEPRNWGYAGDLGHVEEMLDGLSEFLGL